MVQILLRNGRLYLTSSLVRLIKNPASAGFFCARSIYDHWQHSNPLVNAHHHPMPASSLRRSRRLTRQSSRIDKVIPSSRSLPRLWQPGNNINRTHTDDFSCVDAVMLDCFTPAAFAKTGSIYRHYEEAAPTSCACIVFLCLHRLPMPASFLRGSRRLTWQSSRIDKVIPSSRSLPRLWRPGNNINRIHTDNFSCVDAVMLDCFTPAAFAKTGSIYRHYEEAAPTSCACIIFPCPHRPCEEAAAFSRDGEYNEAGGGNAAIQ